MDVQLLKMVVIVMAALFLAASSGYDTVSGKASDGQRTEQPQKAFGGQIRLSYASGDGIKDSGHLP